MGVDIIGTETPVSKEQSGMRGRMEAVSKLAERGELILAGSGLNDQVFVTIGEEVKKGDGVNFIKSFI